MNFLAPLALAVLLTGFGSIEAAETSGTPGAEPPSSAAAGEFRNIEAADDAAQTETDRWTKENKELQAKGAGISDVELARRVAARFQPVREAYEKFLSRHPADAHAHLVYGGFLNDREDEHGAQMHWERALELDPANPAIYNNLAGRYTESGPVNKAFEYFARAIELAPAEAAYYHNFGDCLYVRRGQAAAFFGITEQQVFSKVLLVYSNALRLDPHNFAFARDLAQTYYSVKPLPVESALGAWTNAWRIATEEVDREDATVHLARVKMLAGRYPEARTHLDSVTNQVWTQAKTTLLHNLSEREKEKP